MKTFIAAALLGLSSTSYGQISKTCPSTNICYSLNIPANTASSGNGDIFIQMSAPTSNTWVALGQGKSMSGAQMFVMYTSANGQNVTISPRLSSGHQMPTYNSAAQITMLDGSGVSKGVMTANFKCSSCQSWSGGSMDFTQSSGTWVHASHSGSSLNSDDKSATISQHGSDYGSFTYDFSAAKGGSSVNPFTSSSTGGTSQSSCRPRSTASSASSGASSATASATTTSAASNGVPSGAPAWVSSRFGTAFPTAYPSGASSMFGPGGNPWPTGSPFAERELEERADLPYCDETGNGNGGIGNSNNIGNNGQLTQSTGGMNQRMLIAHGVLACLAFAILFPFGGIAIRLFSFPGLVWVHAGFQIFAYVVYIIAFGLGVYMATGMGYLNEYHPIIGIVLFIVLFFQPLFGFAHHALFKKYGGRTFWSYAHLWIGRLAITLGIINGGLGFLLADNTRSGAIAYGVIAGLVWIVYVASIIIGEMKRSKKARNAPEAPPKYVPSAEHSPDGVRDGEQPREFYGSKNTHGH